MNDATTPVDDGPRRKPIPHRISNPEQGSGDAKQPYAQEQDQYNGEKIKPPEQNPPPPKRDV